MEDPKRIYKYFWVSIVIKGVLSALEVVGGLLVLFVSPAFVNSTAFFLTRGELAEDPNDFISNQLLHTAHSFSASVQVFLAIYLLTRGLIKLGLVFALLKNKLWAYPASLIVLGLFVTYQIYQIISQHSAIVVLVTVFDLIVMYFIYREWQIVDPKGVAHTRS